MDGMDGYKIDDSRIFPRYAVFVASVYSLYPCLRIKSKGRQAVQLLAQLRLVLLFGGSSRRRLAGALCMPRALQRLKQGVAAPRTSVERNGQDVGKRHLMEAPVYAVCLGGFGSNFSLCGWWHTGPPRPRGALPVAGMSRFALWTAPSEES